jgi:hypothetical protein
LFFVLVSGVLFFGGFTFVIDICIKEIVLHQSLDSAITTGIAMEKVIAGIAWGSPMWFIFGRGTKNVGSQTIGRKST